MQYIFWSDVIIISLFEVLLFVSAGERLPNVWGKRPDNTCVDMKINASAPVTLVGFSKGCMVQNQLLCDLALAKQDNEGGIYMSFQDDVLMDDWGMNTYITQEPVLKSLVGAGINVLFWSLEALFSKHAQPEISSGRYETF